MDVEDRLECQRARRLIDAAVDGELDPITQGSFDAHLSVCGDCAMAHAARLALVDRVRSGAERFTAPDALKRRLLAALPRDAAIPAPKARRWSVGPWSGRWLAGAWVGSMAAVAASVTLFLTAPSQQDQLNRDLVAAHVRSLMPNHLTDVPSSDKHTVKPWFNGRVALSPPVPDLAENGYPLAGGRLDYVGDHTTAALVYRRNQHVINLFIWAAPGAPDRPLHSVSRNGYNLLEWTQHGMVFAAVSDVAMPDLETFQHLWSARALEGEGGEPPKP